MGDIKMSEFRSHKDGTHYKLNKRKVSTSTHAKGTAHLSVPKFKVDKITKLRIKRDKLQQEFDVANEAKNHNMCDRLRKDIFQLNRQISKEVLKERSEHKAEVAMVKDESEGHAKYMQMAKVADSEGRHEDAKVFRQHASDESRHEKEDKKIVQDWTKSMKQEGWWWVDKNGKKWTKSWDGTPTEVNENKTYI
jgi:hypothetical protein